MFTLNCKGRLLVVDKPLVMGIINTTPDSFYEGSRFMGDAGILKQAEKMLAEGADILDIGGQSTRPRSEQVPVEEELQRVIPAIESLHFNFPQAVISIDTYQSKVAAAAVAAGASIINDISAGSLDKAMLTTAGSLQVPYVCMHMKGTPASMQQKPEYESVTREVLDFFIQKIALCKQAGITDIIIDPGFGFGKTIQHNFELLKNLAVFKMLEYPLLLGISRKSTIYKTLGITAEEAMNGTTVLNTVGILNGANILRVHDVKEAREAVLLTASLE
jgi:dihydropteroate synthase